jgi:F-type H+-transporting ATPase subunit gamma
MATLRDLRKRIKAVKNTQKITKAMKMVAASKLRRAQEAIVQARPYATRMDEVLQDIVNRAEVSAHPLLAMRVPHRVLVVVVSSNRGLCGGFNSNIIRSAERYIAENRANFDDIHVATIGRKAKEHFRRKGVTLDATYEGIWDNLNYEAASEIAVDLSQRFVLGKLDAVYIIYNEFKSAISQKVTVHQLLPVRPLEGWRDDPRVRIGELAAVSGNKEAVAGHTQDLSAIQPTGEWDVSEALELEPVGYEHIYEPSQHDVLEALLPEHLAVQIWRALLESNAAEHGARMSAMDAASRNAKDLIEKLTLKANRERQAVITTELMEIVSGAESLKG